ncbi:MAG TPA: OmpH family outer membrane protein [Myxococcales bacterium]|nr:OmpH family outer membrane protein [Myxococcales bacterium]
MSFRRFVLGAALALPMLIPVSARAELKVGYVDLQRALSEVEEARAAKARLQSSVNAKQKELEKEQDALRKEKETLDKQMSTMNDEARRAKQTEFEGKYVALMQKLERSKAELAESEQKELAPILGRMQKVISQVAEREGLTLVLDKNSGLLYAPPSLELTNEVVRLYNDQFKSKGPAAKDAPKAPPGKPSDAPKK